MTTPTDIVHVDARQIVTGGDVHIETYDGRRVLANVAMIRQLIPGTNKGNDCEITAFLQFCLANKLDPFRRQVYFIKYSSNDPASWVVSWHVYLDRASRHPQYDGYENGIVWEVNGKITRGQPCDYSAITDGVRTLGGWARVHRKDRKHPAYVEVPLAEMQKRTATWTGMTTTMATKTPTARALRAAFPEELGHTYAEGEIVPEATDVAVEVKTREERADELASPTLHDVKAAVMEKLFDQDIRADDATVAGVMQKLARRATGHAMEFADDSEWPQKVCEECIAQIDDFGLDPEWLPSPEAEGGEDGDHE